MTTRALLVTLVFVAVAGVAVPAAADYQTDDGEDAPVGAEIASVVQTTDAEAESAVEDGVFQARLDRANETERAALVERRSEQLDARADRIESRVDEVERENGSASVRTRARAAGIVAQLRALNRSANLTAERASAAGVEPSGLDGVRERTDALRTREGVRIARGLERSTVPGSAGQGPPDDASERGAERGGPAERGTDASRDNESAADDEAPGHGDGNGDGAPSSGPNDDAGDRPADAADDVESHAAGLAAADDASSPQSGAPAGPANQSVGAGAAERSNAAANATSTGPPADPRR